MEKALKGEKVKAYETVLVTKNNEKIDVEVNAVPQMEDGKIVSIRAILRDITDRKKAEEALQASEERYRNVVEDQSEFIVRWLPGGIRTFVNESYCRHFGKTREEVIGTSFFPLISEEDLEKVQRRIDDLTIDCPASMDEHRVILPDGTIAPCDRTGYEEKLHSLLDISLEECLKRMPEAKCNGCLFSGSMELNYLYDLDLMNFFDIRRIL